MTIFLLRPMLLLAALMSALVAGALALGDSLQHQQEFIYVDAERYPTIQYFMMDLDRGLRMPMFKRDIFSHVPIRFSPDGRFMVVMGSTVMLVYEIETGRAIELPTTHDMHIWSEDSRTMIYRSASKLMAFDLTNWQMRELAEMTFGSPTLAWPKNSPTFWLYQTHPAQGNTHTGSSMMIDPTTGESQSFDVLPPCAPASIASPVVSRDGRHMACLVLGNDNDREIPDIFVYEFTDEQNAILGHRVSVENGAGLLQWLAWSPDSQQVLSQTIRNRNGVISAYDVTTGEETPIVTDDRSFVLPTWAPDGRYFAAYYVDKMNTDYVMFDLIKGEFEHLPENPVPTNSGGRLDLESAIAPHWSANGRYFSFVRFSFEEDFSQLIVVAVDTSKTQVMGQWTFQLSSPSTLVGWRP